MGNRHKKNTPRKGVPDRQSSVMCTVAFFQNLIFAQFQHYGKYKMGTFSKKNETGRTKQNLRDQFNCFLNALGR